MRYFFIVQGEGRGHLTQAISLYELLIQNGHEVCAMAIGGRNQAFVASQVGVEVEIHQIAGPKLAYGKHNEGLSISKTIWQSLKQAHVFIGEFQRLSNLFTSYKPDAVINFYEPLAGLYKFFHPFCKIPFYSIAHQYLFLKTGFEFPKKTKYLDKFLLQTNSKITAFGSKRIVALSFDRQENTEHITIVAPLIRKSIKNLKPENKGHYLVYLTHECMLSDLLHWKIAHPKAVVHCFIKREGKEATEYILPNLSLHQPNTAEFQELLRTCSGIASTAGFETISEAVLMDKPVLMVPVKNHFEQRCNAQDGERYGIGIQGISFDLNLLMHAQITHVSKSKEFKRWLNEGEKRLLDAIGVKSEMANQQITKYAR